MRNWGKELLWFVRKKAILQRSHEGQGRWRMNLLCAPWLQHLFTYSTHTEGPIPEAVVSFSLLRTPRVFSNKLCKIQICHNKKDPWDFNLHTLSSFGKRECKVLPEDTAANIAIGLLPFHLFNQQLFNVRAESSQCPQAREVGSPLFWARAVHQ